MPTPGRARLLALAAPVALIALVAVAFHNALPEQFIYDNALIVRDHELFVEDSSWWQPFTVTYWGYRQTAGLYRPLTILSFWIERSALGVDTPGPIAAVNVMLHGAATLLLWSLARVWTGPGAWHGAGAFVAAALFAVHPIGTEVVPNLVGRADILALIAVLAALLLFERWLAEPRWYWFAGAAAVWLLGLLSKESAACFLPIAYLRHAWTIRRSSGPWWALILPLRRLDAYLAFLAVFTAFFAVWTYVTRHAPPEMVFGVANPLQLVTRYERWLTVPVVWLMAVRQALFPLWLAADYSPSAVPLVTSPLDGRFILSGLTLIAGIAAAVIGWRRRWVGAMGLAFFAMAFFPVSNTTLLIGTIFADRLIYLPAAGLCLTAGAAWSSLGQGLAAGSAWRCGVMAAAAAACVAMMGARTIERNPVWSNLDAFVEALLRDQPQSFRGWIVQMRMTAQGEQNASRLQIAADHGERALVRLRPQPVWSYANILVDTGAVAIELGEAMKREGQSQSGDERLVRGVNMTVVAIHHLRTDNPRTRQTHDAYRWFRQRDIEVPSPWVPTHSSYVNLGKAFTLLERPDLAASAFQRASQYGELEPPAMGLFARALARSGKLSEAERVAEAALTRSPEDPALADDLRAIREAMGQKGAADEAEIP